MSEIAFYLAAFFLAILGTAFFRLELVLPLIIFYAVSHDLKKASFFAFGSGLFTDLVSGQFLGVSSIFYLLASAGVLLYKNRYQPKLIPVLAMLVFWEAIYGLFIRGYFQ